MLSVACMSVGKGALLENILGFFSYNTDACLLLHFLDPETNLEK